MMNDAQHKTSKFLFSIAIALMLALIATGAFAKPSAQLLAKADQRWQALLKETVPNK